MIAAALIIIFVVVRYISGTGQQASSLVDIASLQSQAELAKTNLQARGWWDNDYTLSWDGSSKLTIKSSNTDVATIDISNSAYLDDIKSELGDSSTAVTIDTDADTLGEIYDKCMDENNELACKILAALGGS